MKLLVFTLASISVGAPNSQPLVNSYAGDGFQIRPNEAADLQVLIKVADKRSTTDQYTSFDLKNGNITSKSRSTYATRLHLTLELNFRNAGKRPILLYKDSKVVPDWAISLTEKAALSKKYTSQMTSHQIADEDFRKAGWRDDEPRLDQFIVLNPGQSETVVRPYSFVPSDKNGNKLKAGQYYLQLWVQTWYYYADVEKYRERWRDKGYVWSEVLRPNPIVFLIEG
jgi:hypothetical protein